MRSSLQRIRITLGVSGNRDGCLVLEYFDKAGRQAGLRRLKCPAVQKVPVMSWFVQALTLGIGDLERIGCRLLGQCRSRCFTFSWARE